MAAVSRPVIQAPFAVAKTGLEPCILYVVKVCYYSTMCSQRTWQYLQDASLPSQLLEPLVPYHDGRISLQRGSAPFTRSNFCHK